MGGDIARRDEFECGRNSTQDYIPFKKCKKEVMKLSGKKRRDGLGVQDTVWEKGGSETRNVPT